MAEKKKKETPEQRLERRASELFEGMEDEDILNFAESCLTPNVRKRRQAATESRRRVLANRRLNRENNDRQKSDN